MELSWMVGHSEVLGEPRTGCSWHTVPIRRPFPEQRARGAGPEAGTWRRRHRCLSRAQQGHDREQGRGHARDR